MNNSIVKLHHYHNYHHHHHHHDSHKRHERYHHQQQQQKSQQLQRRKKLYQLLCPRIRKTIMITRSKSTSLIKRYRLLIFSLPLLCLTLLYLDSFSKSTATFRLNDDPSPVVSSSEQFHPSQLSSPILAPATPRQTLPATLSPTLNDENVTTVMDAIDEREYLAYYVRMGLKHTTSKSDHESMVWSDVSGKSKSDRGDMTQNLAESERHQHQHTQLTVEFGTRHRDHIGIYTPLCMNVDTGEIIKIQAQTQGSSETSTDTIKKLKSKCNGYNRTSKWFEHNCENIQESSERESLLAFTERQRSVAWIQEEERKELIHWVEGNTIIQHLDNSGSNIAHFCGKVLMLQHLIDNMDDTYSNSDYDKGVNSVIIIPSREVLKRLLDPEKYFFYHKQLLQAVAYPFTDLFFGSLYSLINSTVNDGVGKQQQPLIRILDNGDGNDADNHDHDKERKHQYHVCFRRAIVPTLLKGRFFIDDKEYLSSKRSMENGIRSTASIEGNTLSIPRDSLRLRHRVRKLLGTDNKGTEPSSSSLMRGRKKRIILIDRVGKRRAFDDETRTGVIGVLNRLAEQYGYGLTVSSFTELTFREQVGLMSNAGIAIGIHGANLVNTIFMPPLSALIELFPHGFDHRMYENGGNSGLKYWSYMASEGVMFKDLNKYRSVPHCIQVDLECKIHYRDLNVHLNEQDLVNMTRILHAAFHWHNALLL